MTVASELNRVTYTGNGATTAFAISFPFQSQSDLVVVETIIATGVQTTKTLTTHYTISGSTDSLGYYSSGGTVNAVTAPASTVRWTIYRDPDLLQSLNLSENNALPAESLEAQLDYLTMLVSRLKDRVDRSLRQPDGDSANIAVLPSKVDRASKYLSFDANGEVATTATVSGSTAITTGTWSPVVTCTTPGNLSMSYVVQSGSYVYIGGLLWLSANLICTPTHTTASGQIRITGSPYDTASATNDIGLVNIVNAAGAAAYKSHSCYMETPNTLKLNKVSHDAFTPLNIADWTSGAEVWVYLSIVMKAA